MIRRVSGLVLALAFLPGFVSAQEAGASDRTHVVVQGETLWGLAERYYGDPFLWPRIWEANRAQVADPDLILPDQELVIPGVAAPAVVGGVDVRTPGEPPAGEPAEGAEPPVSERDRRTVFYRDPDAGTGIQRSARRDFAVVSRDQFWSAPWLWTGAGAPPSWGEVVEFLEAGELRTAMPFMRIRVRLRGDRAVDVGDRIRTYRVDRVREDGARVVHPTGVLTVTRVGDGDVTGVVLKEYERIRLGDLAGPAPEYTLEPGQYPDLVTQRVRATVVGFGGREVLPGPGAVVFLDRGAAEGVTVGDEYVAVAGDGPGWEGDVTARVRVVAVQEHTSSARIVSLDSPVFRPGLTVHLDRKMR
ncbi:MAG: LysM peptidoglycan-binding domain-containing protein [Gemmatimonadetes bacterium]|nr:MAG: LysM peptidoglycan-binding domain-containing protein [Gemmatimonadota bacterium]